MIEHPCKNCTDVYEKCESHCGLLKRWMVAQKKRVAKKRKAGGGN